ncbi:MAG: hypothetical protein IJC14_01260, partial [Firmicutes bacterium]|nr:hypothetical protein [Bacillota bacterium]
MENNTNIISGDENTTQENTPENLPVTDVPETAPDTDSITDTVPTLSDDSADNDEKKSAVTRDYKKMIATAITYIIPVLIFFYAASTVIYFITSAYRAEFHADCTDTILWAN